MSGDFEAVERVLKDYYSHTNYVEHIGHLLWKISGFTKHHTAQNGIYISSSTFRIPGDETDFYLELYPNGYGKEHEGYLSLFLQSNRQEEVFLTREFALINVSGEKSNITTTSSNFVGTTGMGRFKFVSRSDLLNRKVHLLPKDELTLSCTVIKAVATTDKSSTVSQIDNRRESTLAEDWTKFCDAGKSSDVVLRVGTQQMSAHKTVLMCRSPVFASMFEHDMLEKDTSEVDIPDVEFHVLVELVRFMYTDAMSPRDVDFALKLLLTADKYDVPSLKARCSKFLNFNVSASDAFQVLKVANACNEEQLARRCMSVIELEMSSVSSLTDWVLKLMDRPEVLPIIQRLLEEKQQHEKSQ